MSELVIGYFAISLEPVDAGLEVIEQVFFFSAIDKKFEDLWDSKHNIVYLTIGISSDNLLYLEINSYQDYLLEIY